MPPHRRPTNIVFQRGALFPHMNVRREHRLQPQAPALADAAHRARVEEMLALVRLDGLGDRGPTAALRRPDPARGARPGARRRAAGAAARRAAVGARPEASPADAARAARHPATARRDVRLRHPRPDRGAGDVRPHRDHEARADRAARHAAGHLHAPDVGLRRRTSSARPTSSRGTVVATGGATRASSPGWRHRIGRGLAEAMRTGPAATLSVRPEAGTRPRATRRCRARRVVRRRRSPATHLSRQPRSASASAVGGGAGRVRRPARGGGRAASSGRWTCASRGR